MEYDKELITRVLNIYGFSLKDIDLDKIVHVPMHGYKAATPDKPLLLVENLQCCVGLYAYGNNFAFAAHINPVVISSDEYLVDKEGTPIYFKRCEDLLLEILKFKGAINESFKIGLSFGYNPLNKNDYRIRLIKEALEELIAKLNNLSIPAVLLEDINEPEFIIDAFNNSIITSHREDTLKL